MKPFTVTVCGCGNGAHVAIGLLAAAGARVHVFSPIEAEIELLKENINFSGGIEVNDGWGILKGKPERISSDPGEVIPGSDMVLLIVPAFAHRPILEMAAPYLAPHTVVGAIPARSGFEFDAARLIPHNPCFGLQTLPWACRINEFGKKIDIKGTKGCVQVASVPPVKAGEIAAVLSPLLKIPFAVVDSMLILSLGNIGQIVHPGIMYGLFRDNPDVTFREGGIPHFYQSVNDDIAALLSAMSQEILKVAQALEEQSQGIFKASRVLSLEQWLLISYGNSIGDRSSLARMFQTNSAYAGLKVPVRRVARDFYAPDFQNRYLTEDIPYGLLVTFGLALLAGVKTPVIQEVIENAGSWSGRSYIVNGMLSAESLAGTRVPQALGFSSVREIMEQTGGAGRSLKEVVSG